MELRHVLYVMSKLASIRHNLRNYAGGSGIYSFYYLETNIKQDYTRSNVHELSTTYSYEKRRIGHPKNRLAFSLDEYNFVQEKQDTEVKFIVDVLKPNKIQLLCETFHRELSENNIIDYHMLGNYYQDLAGSLQQMEQQIEGLDLSPQKTSQCIH